MSIREGQLHDIPSLVRIDHNSYGNYGADEGYFQQKFQSSNTKIIVTESDGKVTGFVVFEVMEPGQQLESFCDLEITKPIINKWMHIIVFTTATNFKDTVADSKLLKAAEYSARKFGCTLFCVPLSVDHPYIKNDVFGFWERNGYKKMGTIKWVASPTEKIDCYFYSKPAPKK